MRPFAPAARLAAIAAASACALVSVSVAAAAGPVFAVVPDGTSGDGASLVLATPNLSPQTAVSLSSLSQLTGSDSLAASALQQQPLGAQAISIALRYIGVPYLWGGSSPSGFDCSGLAMYVYGLLGISLPHYTGAQFQLGYRVPADQLQAGDLLFFDVGASGDPGHEGIYIGRGLFVQAPHTGDIVRVSSLSEPSRALSYVGAVRPY